MNLDSGKRKARKDHECSLCGLKIISGTKYEYHNWVDLGSIHEMKYHYCCAEKTKHWTNDDWEAWVSDHKWFQKYYKITQEKPEATSLKGIILCPR